jgi:hypothetical protein
MGTTIRVRGVTYRDPDAARVAAEDLRHRSDELAHNLRRSGREGAADELQDRGHADASRLLDWARLREEEEARRTEQPPDRPKPRVDVRRDYRSGGGRGLRAANAGAGRLTRRTAAKASRAAHRDVFSGGYRRSGLQAATVSAAGFGWQLAGWIVGVAILTLLVSARGTAAAGGLFALPVAILRLIVSPIDPLAKGALQNQVASSSTTSQAETFAQAEARVSQALQVLQANRRAVPARVGG